MTEGLNPGQKRIVESLDGFMVVDAGPGTGKTFTIMRRYLNFMRQPGIAPGDVLLLTFTHNAAEEMRERIVAAMALEGRGSDGLLVQASTFSSFCMNVVLRRPEAVHRFLGVPERLSRSARLVENDYMNERFFQQVYKDTLRDRPGAYGRAPAVIGSRHKDLHAAIRRLMTLGAIPLWGGWFGDGESIVRGERDLLLSRLRAENAPEGRRSKLLTRMEKWQKDGNVLPHPDGGRWEGSVPESVLAEALDQDREDLLRLVHDVYLNLIRRSMAENRLSFGLLELFAFIILHSDRGARREHAHRYLMIDEFQDTNELQFMIALLLLEEPNLCVVGDWKQGIYGFRFASIENITEFEEKLEHLHKLLNRGEERIPFPLPAVRREHLTENYRSHPAVIETSFRALYSHGTQTDELDKDWLDRNVTPLTAANEEVCSNGSVEFLEAGSNSKEAQYDMILDRVLCYLQDPNTLIADGGEMRRARLGDIAVLSRNGRPLQELKIRADQRGIPAYLDGDMEVLAGPEGKLLLAWLRYLEDRRDPRALAVILDWEGLSLSAMERFLDKEAPEEILALREDLESRRGLLLEKRRRVTALIASIFEQNGMDNDICQSIISLLSALQRESMVSINEIIRMLEEDIQERKAHPLERSLRSDAICLQTMHGSKGLEYPIVIVARIDRGSMPMSDRDNELLRMEPEVGLRMRELYHEEGGVHRIYRDWRWGILGALFRRDLDEERRLLFVALSRARQHLCVTSHLPSQFFKDLSQGKGEKPKLRPQPLQVSSTVGDGRRPVLETPDPRPARLTSHDLGGEAVHSGGKGKEHGRRVHQAAELMLRGQVPNDDLEEIARLRELIDSLAGAEQLLSEEECFLPLEGASIRGAVDLVAVFSDRVEIHDFKTDGSRRNEELYHVQVSVYAHAAASLGKPVRCFLQYLSLGLEVELDPLPLDDIQRRVNARLEGNDI